MRPTLSPQILVKERRKQYLTRTDWQKNFEAAIVILALVAAKTPELLFSPVGWGELAKQGAALVQFVISCLDLFPDDIRRITM